MGRKFVNRKSRWLALVLAFALVTSNLPLTVFAADGDTSGTTAAAGTDTNDALTEQDDAADSNTTESVGTDQAADTSSPSTGDTTDGQQNEVSSPGSSETPDTSSPNASDSANSAVAAAPRQNQEPAVLEVHGEDKVNGSEIWKKVGLTFGAGALGIRIKLQGAPEADWKNIGWSSWSSYSLEAGIYDVQKTTNVIRWEDLSPIQIVRYYNAAFNVSGTPQGGVQVEGTDTDTAKINKGETLTFTVTSVDGYNVTVSDGTNPLTPNDDGSYTIGGTQDWSIAVTYEPIAKSTVHITNPENGTIKINDVSNAQVDVANNADFTIEVTPDKGYAVTEVKVNDESLSSVKYSGQTATVSYTAGESQEYQVTATVVKAGFAQKEDPEVGYREGMDADTIAQNIFNAVVDTEKTVPTGLTAGDVTVTYLAATTFGDQWEELDWEPGTFEKLWAHAFGKDQETIKISYTGNDQYPAFETEATVKLVDPREATVLTLNEGVSVQYNTEDVMNQELYQTLIQSLMAEDGTEVAYTYDDFTFSYDNREVGECTVTVSYKGNDDYAECQASAVVTIEKGDAKVIVNSQNITYGDQLESVFSSDPSDAKVIGVIAGVDGNGKVYVSVDFADITLNDISSSEIPLIGNESIQEWLQTVGINEIKLGELTNVLSKLPGNIEFIGQLQQVIDMLETVAPGALDTTISIGGLPKEAGIYTAVGVTVNPNYNTAVNAGLITIAPKTSNVTLAFNQELPDNGTLKVDEVQNFVFGGYVKDGDAAAEGNVRTFYTGVSYDGQFHTNSSPILEPGVYTETVYVLGGNYFATPIVRTYVIGREQVEIRFDQQYAMYRYDGDPHGLTAGVYNEVGERIADAEIRYMGLESDLTGYYSKEQPVDAGLYNVKATFEGDAVYSPAVRIDGTVFIAKSWNKGTVEVGDATTVYGDPFDVTSVDVKTEGLADRDVEMIKQTLTCDGDDSQAGSHAITVTIPQKVSKNYYRDIDVKNGTHTIQQKDVTITAKSYSIYYREPFSSYEYVVDGVDSTQDLGSISVVKAEEGDSVGTYTLEVKVENQNPNYNYQLVPGTLTIEQRPVTLMIDDQNITYGDEVPELTASFAEISSTVTLEDFPNLKLSVDSDEKVLPAGQYTISAEGLDNSNFAVSVQNGTLTVNQKPVSVTIDAKQKTEGDKDPALTYTVDDNGLVGNDDLGLSLIREEGEEVGFYDIYMDQSEEALQKLNPNYVLTSTPDGTDKFEIVKKEETVSGNDTTNQTTNGQNNGKAVSNEKTADQVVKTGDQSNMLLSLVVVFGAAIVAAGVIVFRRRRR